MIQNAILANNRRPREFVSPTSGAIFSTPRAVGARSLFMAVVGAMGTTSKRKKNVKKLAQHDFMTGQKLFLVNFD